MIWFLSELAIFQCLLSDVGYVPTPNVHSDVWDHVESYIIYMLLTCKLEITFTFSLKLIISIFGTVTTVSFTFSNSHFFSGQSQHAFSSLIVLYLWLGARRPTVVLLCCRVVLLVYCCAGVLSCWCIVRCTYLIYLNTK
jgi:hypothetical protein